MIISNSRRFVYVHLHKCAGTSIEKALAAHLSWNDILLGSTKPGEAMQPIYQKMFGLRKHSGAEEIAARVGWPVWERYYCFSTVRNPFSRAVSQYVFSMRQLALALNSARAANQAGLLLGQAQDQSWRWSYPGIKALLANGGLSASFGSFIRSPEMDGWAGFLDQKRQLSDASGNLIVDGYFKVEELNRAWPEILARLRLPRIPIGWENRSQAMHGDYRQYYQDSADVEFVRERYQADFKCFGYSNRLE